MTESVPAHAAPSGVPAPDPTRAALPEWTSRRVLLLVSPVSGGGRGERALGAVVTELAAHGIRAHVHRSESLADARAQVRAAGPDALVLALGGDGLIGAAAGAAAETGALLLPLAGGRGNDTVRRFGLGLEPAATVRRLPELREGHSDLAWITTEDGPAARGLGYLGVCATGFDGVANELGNAVRWKLGPFTYLVGGVRALFQFRGAHYTLSVDGRERSGRGWFVAIANHGQYGGGIRVSPNSRIDDGRLDVVGLWGGSVARVAAVLLAAYRGAHLSIRGVAVDSGREFRLAADHPLGIYVDGERVGTLPATVSVRPAALRVLTGPNAPAVSPG